MNKIDPEILMRMLNDGVPKSHIARHFGVTWNAVHKMAQRIKRDMALVPDTGASELAKDNINVAYQLRNMNDRIILELERCKRLIDREDKLQVERDGIEDKLRKNPKDTILIEQLKAMGYSKIGDILKIQSNLISLSAEVRKQIELQVKVFETIFNVQMVSDFQEDVIKTIKDESPETAQKIIKALKRRRSLRGLVRIDK